MTKAEEIEYFHALRNQAREAGAETIAEALDSLQMPVEYAIHSDYLGEVAAEQLLSNANEKRAEILKLLQEVARLRREADAQQDRKNQLTARRLRAEADLEDIRTKIHNLFQDIK